MPSTALSAILPVAIVFAAIWSVVIWSSSICLVKILFDAIFVPSIALSATFPVAIVFAAIWSVVT